MKQTNLFLLLFALSFNIGIAQTTIFSDDFETPQTWTIFEEIVSGNACYGDNIGEVTRSTDLAQAGTNALRVWSNKNGMTKSNHVIAAHHISNTNGITGRLRYGMWAYNATTIGLTQSSPEFSVQSTRTVGAQNLTYIAGIQYIGNQWVTDKWNIWHNGTWQTIKASEFGTTLASNTWYYLELEFDLTINTYISFKIQGGGLNQTLDLTQAFQNATSGFKIGAEARNWQPSLFVTAESENLWTNCAEVREDKVYYDNVTLESLNTLPVELIDFKGVAEKQGNLLIWKWTNTKDLDNVVLQKSSNGIDFKSLNNTTSCCEFLDEIPFSLSYYRLKIKDLDGTISFSKIIALQRPNTEGSKISIYPNPATSILIVENAEGQTIEILNVLGQIVATSKANMQQMPMSIAHLTAGIYFVKTGNTVLQFIKN